MKQFKHVLYYGGWSMFWLAIFSGVIYFLVETKMFRFAAPFFFLAIIGYALYAMFKTKPQFSETSKDSEVKEIPENEPVEKSQKTSE